jgi:signal transduction histidine kinase
MSNESQISVLVVEDDVNLLTGIRDILELENYRVMTAQNGLEGLKVLEQAQDRIPDVIVSDVMMPFMDGFSFLERVRQNDAWGMIPFIFLTAKGERSDRHRGTLMGAEVYLTKPFDAVDLLVSVSGCLRNRDRARRVQDDKVSDVKKQILTILNHEFRTPLTLVVAYAEMLKEFDINNMSSTEVLTFLKGVNSGADRLRRLVENFIVLVELTSGDAGKTMVWRRHPIHSMKDLVNDALRQVALEHERPRHFELHIEANLPPIILDQNYMTIAIRELLDNAAKFSHNNSTIAIHAHRVDEGIEIVITDQGRGIPLEEWENIWKPFYQIEREQYEDQGSGSGLGIVDGVVRLHGGRRSLSSEVGKGSTFAIWLPFVAPPE